MSKPIERNVEIVTLAFPGGAENKIETGVEFDGVRPSMIIYGMRWWFRALAGAIRGTEDLEGIRTAESAIFGTARKIQLNGQEFAGLSSRVRGAIVDQVKDKDTRDFPSDQDKAELKYLAYGLFPTDREQPWQRKCVKEGAKFTFRLLVSAPRGKGSREPVIAEELVGCLADLWIELGGLGARWRHGLGSMRNADLGAGLKDAARYGESIKQNIDRARKLVQAFLAGLRLPDSKPSGGTPKFPIALEPHFQLAWRLNSGITATEALETIHSIWRGRRLMEGTDAPTPSSGNRKAPASSLNKNLYKEMALNGSVDGHSAQLAGLGLPIPFGFPQMATRPTGSLKPTSSSRRASPIWFRVVRVSEKQYGLLMMLWDCEYLPEGEGVVVQMTRGQTSERLSYDPEEAAAWFEAVATDSKYGFKKA